MAIAHSQGVGAMRRVMTSLHLDELSRLVDLRVAYDVAVVSATLLIGALLWLALARPIPATPSGVVATQYCGLSAPEGRPCASAPSSH